MTDSGKMERKGKPLDLSNLKGTRDYLPEAQRIRARVIRTLEDTFALYGYPPLETPMLNRFDVLASKYAGGAEILKEIYRLRDQGNRDLALRYDLTVPFAKVMGLNPERPLPFRRYEIGRVFRDGPVKAGRNREFTQCDVDVVGISSVLAEAEMMQMAVRVYTELGLDIVIRYNNRKWLQAVVAAAGIRSDNVLAVLAAVDKLEKAGQEAVCLELTQCGTSMGQQERLFSLLRMSRKTLLALAASGSGGSAAVEISRVSGDDGRELPGIPMEAALTAHAEALGSASAELEVLESALDVLGVTTRTVFTPTLTRGLDIYTGTVWEVFMTSGDITSSIGAGGRYDRIIGAFLDVTSQVQIPAVGMTFGLDVIYAVLEMQNRAQDQEGAEVVVVPVGLMPDTASDQARDCLRLVSAIREQGVPAVLDLSGRRLRQAMRDAARRNAPYVVLVGEAELVQGCATVRVMATGQETSVPLGDVGRWLRAAGAEGDTQNG